MIFGTRMRFATNDVVSHLGELHKSKEDTGDFTLTCKDKVIKAHSWVLGMGSVSCSCECECDLYFQV